MKIYDISQEVFSCEVYPGDPAPQMKRIMSKEGGDVCNLTEFSMCAHNGTHIDAPFHFTDGGMTVDMIPLEKLIGPCFVTEQSGDISVADAAKIIKNAAAVCEDCENRILIKGNATITADAARYFAEAGVFLIGNESQTVGPEDAPMEVHLMLLGAEVVLLEGIRLADVPVGCYTLFAAPLNLGGCDGAPCRAVLVEM